MAVALVKPFLYPDVRIATSYISKSTGLELALQRLMRQLRRPESRRSVLLRPRWTPSNLLHLRHKFGKQHHTMAPMMIYQSHGLRTATRMKMVAATVIVGHIRTISPGPLAECDPTQSTDVRETTSRERCPKKTIHLNDVRPTTLNPSSRSEGSPR